MGREIELARLRAAADAARAGQRQVVLVSGEAGIGKTRLVREVERYALEHGAIACWGRAREATGAPPYWPWTQAGRSLGELVGPEQRRAALRADAPDLQRVFPEIGDLLGEAVASPEGDAATLQFRLFEAVVRLLKRVAGERPVVLVLEDLHWGDRGSLLLFGHLAAELDSAPILLVGTYRDAELGTNGPLSALVAELNREHGFDAVALSGLNQEEIEEYVDRTGQDAGSLGDTEEIRRRTGGNPFYLEQLAELAESNDEATSEPALPDGLRAALAQRLAPLSADARELLSVAAIIGQEFTYATLTLTGLTEEEAELLPLVEEVLERRAIEETPEPGRYRFVHDLMRQALLSELPATRRALLHGRVAEALERRWASRAEEYAARLAAHFVESAAVDPRHVEPAVRYARIAGQRAEFENAWDDAALHYERALALVDQSSAGAEDVTVELLIGLGRSYREEYRVDDSWEVLGRAIRLAREQDRPILQARATLEASRVFGPSAEAVAWVKEALDALGTRDPHLEASLHVDLLRAIRRSGLDEAELAAHRARAVDLASRHGFADIDAAVAHGDGVTAELSGRYADAVKHGDQAWRGFERVGLRAKAVDALHRVAANALSAGQIDLAIGRGETCAVQSRRFRLTVWESLGNAVLLAAWIHRGEFERAASLATTSRRESSESLMVAMQIPHLHITTGDLDLAWDAVEVVSAMRAPVVADGLSYALHATRARYWFARGDEAEARREFELAAGAWTAEVGDSATSDPPDRWRTSLALAFLGDAFAELASADELRAWFDADPDRPPFFRSGSPLLSYAQAALKLGEHEIAESSFRGLLAIATGERTPLVAAGCQLGLSSLAEARDDRVAAQDHAGAAVEVLAALPSLPLRSMAEARLEQVGGAAKVSAPVPAGLTPRELEVLRHVAAGLSSREIAEELVLSVRTVERHIANIYRKTDTHSRAQATAFAIRHGLDQLSEPSA